MKSYRQAPGAVSAPRSQGYVVIPLARLEGQLLDNVLLLDGVAGLVWGLLSEPRTLEELGQAVSLQYEVSSAEAQADLEPFLEELRSLQAVEFPG